MSWEINYISFDSVAILLLNNMEVTLDFFSNNIEILKFKNHRSYFQKLKLSCDIK
jgi:hypothetical protein